ncbi:MAG: Rieske (2Fe-2S) iron-sulfur domain protein [Blastococcus sp.]|nr:Rieske (2Fe-2S) iron-sulfur domain protein [Blastococcus sp.]
MNTHDTRPGSTGGADTPGPLHGGPDEDYTPEQLAAMSLDELDRLGARYDGVEIMHVEPGPEPGSPLEKRAVRQIGTVFTLAGLCAFASVVIYAGSGWFLPTWQWSVSESGWSAIFTPLVGALFGAAMILVGVGLVLYTKKLLPHETAVQDKHDASAFDRATAGATLVRTAHNSGLARRKLITRSLAFMGGGLGLMLIMPLGGLIKNPNTGDPLGTTPWKQGVRLTRLDGSPIRPGDQEPGSLETVFPAVPGGNRAANAATMLIRLRPEQVAANRPRPGQGNLGYGDYVAYSKICTHAGCPVSLYEQETSRILCPCHQSQFDVTQGAKPVFGPASRPLPQLPITVDASGYFVARSDYLEAVGPTYWNRRRI